jgi:hypothetical protein
MWSGEDNREAIRSDDTQGKIWAIGEKSISWRSPQQLWVGGLAQDYHPIAMNLPKVDEISRIDANRSSEPSTVAQHASAVITASQTQVQ